MRVCILAATRYSHRGGGKPLASMALPIVMWLTQLISFMPSQFH